MDESTLASLLTMNAPQALASNQKALKKLGGPDGLLDLLETSLHDGISSASISERTGTFGANFTPSAPPPTFLSLLIDSVVEDATVQILIVSALVSLAVGVYDDPETGWIEGAAIIAAVVIVAFVTAGNDYQKEQQFRKLEDVAVSAKDVKVIRDGETHELSSKEVVVGDVVLLEPGDKVSARPSPHDSIPTPPHPHIYTHNQHSPPSPLDPCRRRLDALRCWRRRRRRVQPHGRNRRSREGQL